MTQQTEILTLPVQATATITAERFVTAVGTIAPAGGHAVGVSRSDAAIGEIFPVTALGTAIVTASGVIVKDERIEVAADGKAAKHNAGIAVGVALQQAVADGDRIEVLLIPN